MFIQQVQTCISFFYDILVLFILDFHDFSADCMWFQEGRRLQCSCFSLLTPPSAAQRLAVVLVQEPQQHKPSTLLSSKQPLWSVVEAQWPKHCLIQATRQTRPKYSKCLETKLKILPISLHCFTENSLCSCGRPVPNGRNIAQFCPKTHIAKFRPKDKHCQNTS